MSFSLTKGPFSSLIISESSMQDLFFKDFTNFQNAPLLPLHFEKVDRW